MIYRGKAKALYATNDPDHLIMHFLDDTSAFNGVKLAQLAGKGAINNRFNAFIMQKLAEQGIPVHFERLLSADESLVKSLTMIPVECVVRNIAAGNLVKRLGIAEKTLLDPPILEFYYKSDALGDPMINESHIRTFAWASDQELASMTALSLQINEYLQSLFQAAGMLLVDFKLEFGRDRQGKLVLGDEFTPDGCRLWDSQSNEKMDKDRFRLDLGHVVESYTEVAKRLGIVA